MILTAPAKGGEEGEEEERGSCFSFAPTSSSFVAAGEEGVAEREAGGAREGSEEERDVSE